MNDIQNQISKIIKSMILLVYLAVFVLGILALIFTFLGWGTIRKSFAD